MPVKAKNTSDPKTTALAYMGIAIGSKNLKTLKREEIDEAFTSQFIAAVTMYVKRILHARYSCNGF